jgi:uncharacterized repeat protein (TIGR03803 family)
MFFFHKFRLPIRVFARVSAFTIVCALCTAESHGAAYNVLYNFAGGTADGANPFGSLTLVGSTLYGMTETGGANSDGVIFTLNPTTDVETPLYSFAGHPSDGANPQGSLIQSSLDSTLLYGMTQQGAKLTKALSSHLILALVARPYYITSAKPMPTAVARRPR